MSIKEKIIAITQARMSSTRCPGKVLQPILGYPMAWHQWQRMKRATSIDMSILATSTDSSDDVLADYFKAQNAQVFRGSLNNVLNRYYDCAKQQQASHIIRLTADCPLIDPVLIDNTVALHLKNNNDYTANSLFPVGMSVEIVRFSALEKAYYAAKLSSQREHVTLFIYQHPELFKLGAYRNDKDLSHLRWTVDYPEDFAFVSQIYQRLYPKNSNFSMDDILCLLEKHPELVRINQHMLHNGLINSLNKDRKMTYVDK